MNTAKLVIALWIALDVGFLLGCWWAAKPVRPTTREWLEQRSARVLDRR